MTEAPAKKGWFSRLRDGLGRSAQSIGTGITDIFTKKKLDAETLEELEDLLIASDLGVATARKVAERLAKTKQDRDITAEEVRAVLAATVTETLAPVAKPLTITGAKPHVILMVGVNGTGKTTTIGKLARQFREEGRKVMLAAGDTFRAAAIEQLQVWGERSGVPVVTGAEDSDPAALAFDAMQRAKVEGMDVLLIDTAGRLQNKKALMEELAKIVRVIRKVDEGAPQDTVIVLDATTGQNAVNQVRVFREIVEVTGIVMTKLDGTAKGGVLVACAEEFGLPVHAIGVGEGVEDLQPFDPGQFARALAGIEEKAAS